MGKKTPDVPSPQQQAQAQATANKEAVRESALVNQINQVTPFGTERFTGEIGTPERTRTIELAPSEQAKLGAQNEIALGLLGLGQETLVPQTAQAVGQPIDLSGLPAISGTDDLAAAAQPLEKATFERALNLVKPQLALERRRLEGRLANQGIPLSAEAATGEETGAITAFERGRNRLLENLALDAVGAGRQEQSRLFGLEQAARNQGLSELLTARGQPINELAALIQGAPALNLPGFQGPAQFQVQPPNLLGAQQLSMQAEMAGNRARQDLIGGLLGLGGALGGAALGNPAFLL